MGRGSRRWVVGLPRELAVGLLDSPLTGRTVLRAGGVIHSRLNWSPIRYIAA